MFSEIGCPKGWTETYCEDAAARSVMTPNVILVFFFFFLHNAVICRKSTQVQQAGLGGNETVGKSNALE